MTDVAFTPPRARSTSGFAYYTRVLRVIGGVEFKAKYTDSALGYAWSLAKPLAYFGVLWLVFAHLLRTANETRDFTLFLLLGILLYTFFAEAIGQMVPSIVVRGPILRRLAFPPLLVPLSVTVTACLTFLVNIVAVVVYIAVEKVTPTATWLLIVPLLVELLLFTLGIGLILASLFVRFRDIGQIWDLVAQLLFLVSGIVYPIGILPLWAQRVAFVNPFIQVMQDIRHVVLGGASGPHDPTAASVYAHAGGRLIPLFVVLFVVVGSLFLFRRESPYFAERV